MSADIKFPAVDVRTIAQGKNLFVSGGPGGVLKYNAGETLAAAIADLMQSSPQTTQSFNAAGQSITSVDASAALRSRIDLHHVKLQRDGNVLGDYDTVALEQNGETGPSLEPGDTIVFSYKPIQVRVLGDVALPGTSYLSRRPVALRSDHASGRRLTDLVLQPRLAAARRRDAFAGARRSRLHRTGASGDIITVPAAPRVNVIGTVVTPGVVALQDRRHIAQRDVHGGRSDEAGQPA